MLTWTKGRRSITREFATPDGKLRRVTKLRTPTHRAHGILIRELPANSGSTYFRVEVPARVTGKRILKQFKSLAEAEGYCAVTQGERKDMFSLKRSRRATKSEQRILKFFALLIWQLVGKCRNAIPAQRFRGFVAKRIPTNSDTKQAAIVS